MKYLPSVNSSRRARRSRVFALMLLALALGAMSASGSEQAFYANRFNDALGLELKSGAAIGSDASGVSGKAGDKAYVAKAFGVAAGEAGPAAVVTGGPSAPVTGEEATVTLWYKPGAEIKDAATLFQGFAGQIMWSGRRKQWYMRLLAPPTDPTQKNAGWLYSGSVPANGTAIGEWTFMAFVWKKEGNYSEFYFGSASTPAKVSRQGTSDNLVGALAERDPKKRVIGNDNGKMDRAFDGSIDNLRFYTKALDAAALQKIRAADVANLAVTEK